MRRWLDSGSALRAVHNDGGRARLASPIIKPGAVEISFQSCSYRRANRRLQCFARGYSPADLSKWGDIEGDDACIEITDAVGYLRLIQAADLAGECMLYGKPGEKWYGSAPVLDDVVYASSPYDLSECDFTYPSFHKDRDACYWQNEVRAYGAPRKGVALLPYTLNVPGISKLIRRIA